MSEIISIQIPCNTEYIAIARITAAFVASKLAFDIDNIEDIKIAVSEACNNAIQHSHQSDGFFQIEYAIDKNTFTAKIIDSGDGYSASDYKAPNLDELNENGLGIYIMNALMDSVDIKGREQQGTVVELKKHLK